MAANWLSIRWATRYRACSFTWAKSDAPVWKRILFSAVNDQPPESALAIPDDFVRQMMEGIGLAGREVGLNAMLVRVKQQARRALV